MKYVAAVLLLGMTGCQVYSPAPPPPAGIEPPLSAGETERLLAAGVPADVIAEQAADRGALKLSAENVVSLKKAGANDDLLAKLIAAERPSPPPELVLEPLPAHRPLYYYDPYYPYYYGPSFSFGFGYYRHYHRHYHGGSRIRVYR